MTRLESFLYGLGLSLLSLSTYIIVDTASNHRPSVREPTNGYPDIPQCDKELWDRIREGCDE